MVRPVGAVSPHLDDLALSCGTFLAAHRGSLMVTVFAGGPPSVDPLPWWDRECGVFEPGDDVVGARRAEDVEAATVLAASVRHLEHWDHQYRSPRHGYGGTDADLSDAITADLDAVVDELDLDRWLVPLGVLHPDHRATGAACRLVARRRPHLEWLVYEDLPYATLSPEHRRGAWESLVDGGFALHPIDGDRPRTDGSVKRAAIECYRSQLSSLGDHVAEAIATPERIHRLVIP